MQPASSVSIRRYCAIESRFCERILSQHPFPSAFLAYPSGPHWSQFYTELKEELTKRGTLATTWEDAVTGSVIFTKVCDAIYTHSFVLCEVTTLNLNVLFEAGYSLAAGRDAIFLIDRSREHNQLTLLRTKECCLYDTRTDIHTFISKYVSHVASLESGHHWPDLLELNNINDTSEMPGTLYFLRPRASTQVIKSVDDQLERSPFKRTTSDPADNMFDDFYHQARQIKESELVVGVLVTSKTRDAALVNAPVALLLGFAVGLGKQVLVLQEQPNDPLLDLGTILRPFEGERSARALVEHWIQFQSQALLQSTQRQVSVRRRAVETSRIRNLFLGQPDAMVDYTLMEYFIETPQYRQALNGVKQMFVGRKGAGKSAIFRALQEELRNRQRAILVAIAPTDFQFERLTGLAVDQYSTLHPAFVFQTFWRYILFTEVLRVIGNRYVHFLQASHEPHVRRLLDYIREEETVLEEDFASRALQKLDAVQRIPVGLSNLDTQAQLEALLQRARMNQVERDLQRLAKDYPIHIVIDDVDKYWNPSYEASVRLLLGLVNEAGQMYSRFKGDARTALFLRQDIFDVLRRYDEELVKRNIASLRWDEAQLLRMISERIQVSTETDSDKTDEEIWTTIFPATIGTQAGWAYMIERTLMRPRDLLQFCQIAIEKAQIRRHDDVVPEDVLTAEKQYSEYMFDALRLEYLHVYPCLEEVLFEFGRWNSSGSLAEALDFIKRTILDSPTYGQQQWVAACSGDPNKLLEVLYDVGFCGIGDTARQLLFYSFEQGFTEARALCHADPTVHIHPAFLKALYLQPSAQ
ncbi:MAG TPA: hypothetical protein VF116_22090 [Ktedonobacterales bacterium]